MLISKQWLEQFIDFSASGSGKDIADKLMASTVEVEKVIDQGASLENIVVGKILKVIRHPDADRLKVCEVDIGQIDNQKLETRNSVQIVCGGSNIREGMYVAVALPGAMVRWHGEGEPIKLEETKIRGVESYGMICAADEVGLLEKFPKKEDKAIIDISDFRFQISDLNAIIGKPLAEALGVSDVVLDIDNKSMTHRPDLWGHYGMAREVAALFNVPLKPYPFTKIKSGKKMEISVTVEDPLRCRRYMAVAMDNIKIASSPEWMQTRLRSAGVRPINNIVDITNYVMLELGQPIHAFDCERVNPKSEILNPKSIVVRNAKAGERIVTLDGKERELNENILVIADSEKSLAIAGIFGGEGSGVTDKTASVIFESAVFDASAIRRGSIQLGLRTDASARFEKALDPETTPLALARAVSLALELIPAAKVVSNIADAYPATAETKIITLPVSFVEKKVGVSIGKEKIVDILARLGFIVKAKKDDLTITVPSWRAAKDISIPEDLVEEIIRIYGYNAIPSALPSLPSAPPEKNALRALEHELRSALSIGSGFAEAYNYSFVSPELLQRICLDDRNHLELENPIAKDRPLIRRSLLPGLLQNVEENAHRFSRVSLFEIGKTFLIEEKGEEVKKEAGEYLPKQNTMLGLAYAEKSDETPFFALKDALEKAAAVRGYALRFEPSENALCHPGRSAAVFAGGERIGTIGELHPDIQSRLGVESRVAFAEVSLNILLEAKRDLTQYHPVAAYPAVERDIAFMVSKDTEHARILSAIRGTHQLIAHAELFDVFMGGSVPAGKKSMAYRITYQAGDRTLSTEEVDAAHGDVSNHIKEMFGGQLRS